MDSKLARDHIARLVLGDQSKLESNLNLRNCFTLNDLLPRSLIPNTKEVKKIVDKFMMENFDAVARSPEFNDLGFYDLKMLFESPDTKCESDMIKLEVAQGWVAKSESRRKYFPQLFKQIRFSQMSMTSIRQILASDSFIKEFPECMAQIYSALGATAKQLRSAATEKPVHFAVLDHGTRTLKTVEVRSESNKICDSPPTPENPNIRKIVGVDGQLYLLSMDTIYLLKEDGNWIFQTTLPCNIYDTTQVFSLNKVIYMIDTNEAAYYDLENGTQASVPLYPWSLRKGFCVAMMRRFFYVIGGIGTGDLVLQRPLAPILWSRKDFRIIAPMIQGRAYASAASLGTRLYVMGGEYAGEILSSVEYYEGYYEGRAGVWTMVKNMVRNRAHLAAVSVDGTIYAIGGDHTQSFNKAPADTIEIYDEISNQWRSTGALLSPSTSVCACEVSDYVAKFTPEDKFQTLKVGPEGGYIDLYEYELYFQPNTFKEETEIPVTVITNPDFLPLNMYPTSPVFDCTRMPKLETPLEVELPDRFLLQRLPNGTWERANFNRINASYSPVFIIHQPCYMIAVAADHQFHREWYVRVMERNQTKQLNQRMKALVMKTIEDSVGIVEEIKSEFAQKIKEKAEITRTIGPKGGDVELCGYSLTFPPYALKEEKEITLSVDNNPENYPPNLVAIAPILGFKPSMKFDKPVTVGTRIWYRALEGETIPAVISSRRGDSEWKQVAEIILDSTNRVQFPITHFSEDAIGVTPQNSKNGIHCILNDIYIQKKTAQIISVFCLDEKAREVFHRKMRAKNCSTFTIMEPMISGKPNTKVRLSIKCSRPKKTKVSTAYPASEFELKKVLSSRRHEVCFIPMPRPGSYEGIIEGEYIVTKGRDVKTYPLAREWPVTLDPPDVSVGPTYTAGVMATGGSLTMTATGSKFDMVHKVNSK